jgi:hypothetical protein
MGHPIIDGLLIGLAAGVGSNIAHQAMQPGQTPIWTGTAQDGRVFTIVVTRSQRFEFYAIAHGIPVLLGTYPNWVALQCGCQVWADYICRGGTIADWLIHSAQQAVQHQEDLKRRWEESPQQPPHEDLRRRWEDCQRQRKELGTWVSTSSPWGSASSTTATADLGDANAATTPSPVWLNNNPSWASTAARNTSSCASSAARIASASDSHRRVEPSISVNRNVTTPEGGPPSTPAQDVTPNLLSPRTSREYSQDTPARRGARATVGLSQRRYGTCWLASGDTIST